MPQHCLLALAALVPTAGRATRPTKNGSPFACGRRWKSHSPRSNAPRIKYPVAGSYPNSASFGSISARWNWDW